jgi:thiol-disulfide isomerase/thioredoxin
MFHRMTVLALTLSCILTAPLHAEKLGIGSTAPPLAVKQWVKGDPVTAFAPGKIYVVEFWATWCGPCRTSIPHITELQKKYADKDVTMIGVSILEREAGKVVPFVEKMSDKMAYRVALDDGTIENQGRDGTMARTWFLAAEQPGIPSAFIVDKTGKIAWIGHPMGMDEPLEKIVAGTWDAKAAIERERQIEAAQRNATQVMKLLQEAHGATEIDAQLAAIDELLSANPELEQRFGAGKFELLYKKQRIDAANAYGAKLVDGALKDSPQGLNMMAWTIVDPAGKKNDKRDLALALRAATRANELSGNKEPAVLDTLGLILFEKGDVARAIETQERAVELAKGTPMEAELKERLAQFKQAKL